MTKSNKFYVTTPIYYASARPHLGSLYSTVLADVAARWHQLRGQQTFLLTGTDEHGQKIAQAAAQAGLPPQQFVDGFIADYKQTWTQYQIFYNRFIRTTDSDHIVAVQKWLQVLIDRDLIYKANYEGYYCTPCETFGLEKELAVAGKQILCASCGRDTSFVSEESYFFRLSRYQQRLLDFYRDHPNFVTPPERLNEVIKFVASGLKDLCLSRSSITWGIKFPHDDKHVTYVWADALNNYISAVGYGSNDARRQADFKFWWPADLQVLGKDILRFHAIYWPAFLLASDLALPKALLVHGWIKVGAHKMSKSLGNVVDPIELLKKYGSDAVRYYLVSQMAITRDAEFSLADLEQKISSDLADDLGNLLNRTVVLATKHNLLKIAAVDLSTDIKSQALQVEFATMLVKYSDLMVRNYYHLALAELWRFIKSCNAYFQAAQPWVLATTDNAQFTHVMATVCHGLVAIAQLAWPVLPAKMSELLQRLGHEMTVAVGVDVLGNLTPSFWCQKFELQPGALLFMKFETKNVAAVSMINANAEQQSAAVAVDKMIAIADFAKVELVVGTITNCEVVKDSEKLLKLQVDFGVHGQRQVLSGVKKYFTPPDLIGKQGVFVLNLKSRQMAGLESQGMMLFASDASGSLQRVAPAGSVPNGTRLS